MYRVQSAPNVPPRTIPVCGLQIDPVSAPLRFRFSSNQELYGVAFEQRIFLAIGRNVLLSSPDDLPGRTMWLEKQKS